MIKPRIRKSYVNADLWICWGGGITRRGITPYRAYVAWQLAHK